MAQLAEALPLIFFFGAFFLKGHTVSVGSWSFQFDGFMSATLVLMVATAVLASALWLKHRQLEKRVIFLSLIILVTGSLTLFFHNSYFLMWKPTIFNWGLALAMIGSRIFSKRSLMQVTLGKQLSVPDRVWWRIDLLWICEATIVGSLNLYVAYRYGETTWITYKLYSSVCFMLLLSVLTTMLLAPYLKAAGHDQPTAEN